MRKCKLHISRCTFIVENILLTTEVSFYELHLAIVLYIFASLSFTCLYASLWTCLSEFLNLRTLDKTVTATESKVCLSWLSWRWNNHRFSVVTFIMIKMPSIKNILFFFQVFCSITTTTTKKQQTKNLPLCCVL